MQSNGQHVDESLTPAINQSDFTSLITQFNPFTTSLFTHELQLSKNTYMATFNHWCVSDDYADLRHAV